MKNINITQCIHYLCGGMAVVNALWSVVLYHIVGQTNLLFAGAVVVLLLTLIALFIGAFTYDCKHQLAVTIVLVVLIFVSCGVFDNLFDFTCALWQSNENCHYLQTLVK